MFRKLILGFMLVGTWGGLGYAAGDKSGGKDDFGPSSTACQQARVAAQTVEAMGNAGFVACRLAPATPFGQIGCAIDTAATIAGPAFEANKEEKCRDRKESRGGDGTSAGGKGRCGWK